MYAESVLVPESRIAVLIGRNGKTRKEIEEKTSAKLRISKTGEVTISGEGESVFLAKDIVKAIARGFNPRVAFKLLDPNYSLEIIDLHDFYNTKNSIIRIKGRVIGEKGRIRELIESSTDSYISVFGDTIAIIAPYYTMPYAKESVLKLIRGSKHSSLERFLSTVRERIFYEKLRGK